MIQKHLRLTSGIPLMLDLVTTALAFFITFPLRSLLLDVFPFGSDVTVLNYLKLLPTILIIWYVVFNLRKRQIHFRYTALHNEITYVIKSVLIGEIGLFFILYSFHITSISRTFIWLFGIINLLLLILEKYFFLLGLDYLRNKGQNRRKVLIVGDGENSRKLVDLIEKYSDWGLDIVGFVDVNGHQVGEEFCNSKIIGKLEDLPTVLHSYFIEEVIFALPLTKLEKARDWLVLCETEGVQTRIISDFFSGIIAHTGVDFVHGVPIFTYSTTPGKEMALIMKRMIDIVLSGIGLILFAPVFLVITILIKATSPGPVFYRWKVVGLNKKAFTSFKFRTMVVNADELKHKLMQHNEMKGVAFKMKNDPRITRVGRFLRKFSLDELPQLFSVLKGDMSLVGPRPPLVTEVPQFKSWQRRKLSVKPGITCLWQCSGRNEIDNFDEWVSLDLKYIDNWSLWLDFKILYKTIPAVLSSKGAS
jgi:exopolysaccharide biosynthesis polyprenyl glycosylphosphotransferase